ncbi:MAG: hypothetical protein WBQ37_08495 [Candidatus Competibacter sp.]
MALDIEDTLLSRRQGGDRDESAVHSADQIQVVMALKRRAMPGKIVHYIDSAVDPWEVVAGFEAEIVTADVLTVCAG